MRSSAFSFAHALCVPFPSCAAAAALALGLFLCGGPAARAAKWEPVPAADLAATESAAFPGTDVEILLSTHRMEEHVMSKRGYNMEVGEDKLVTVNFVRAKVYTAKGVTDMGKRSIEFHSDRRVSGVEARVVKRDGSAIELKKSDLFETVLKKTKNKGERKQITFVFPDLEPGDVVEYRWTEKLADELWMEMFFCQETVPVREYHFRVAEMQSRGTVRWLHCPEATTSDKDGYEVVFRNIPAFEEEENMPPETECRGWIYVAKTFTMFPEDKDVWKELSLEWGDTFNMATRPSGALKKKAESLVAGAATDEEKLRRLYEFCQNEIFNTTYLTRAEWQAETDKHKNEDALSPARILEKGRGRWDEVERLFGALARGLGYEVRLACNASRLTLLNVQMLHGWAFVGGHRNVAVKLGDKWQFYAPGCYYMPFGMLAWDDEDAMALLCDTKKVELALIGVAPASASNESRKGRFKLDDEGTLEGDVEIAFSGHLAVARKADTWSQSLDAVNKDYREEVTKRLPAAEVSDIVWTNLDNNVLPLVVKYHVRVPGYAEQAGSRLVFAPSFFEAGAALVFAAAERKYPVFFSHPWSEHDDIEIVLPDGYTLDKPSAPRPVGELGGTFGAAYKLQYNGKTRTFGYGRDFALGNNGVYTFRLESYPALKNLFELLHKSDTHAIMLKPKAAPAPAVPAAEVQPAAAQP